MRRAVGVLCVVFLRTAALVGSAAAADTPGLFDFNPQETDDEPGDTVEVDITLQAISTYDADGVTLAEASPTPTESDRTTEDDATGMTGDGFESVTVPGAVLVLLTVLSIRRW